MIRKFSATASPFLKAEKFVNAIKFVEPGSLDMPLFQVIDLDGNVISGAEQFADLPKDLLNQMLKTMIQTEQYDNVMVEEQALGKISFYMTNWGEEACHAGSAAALEMNDPVYAQYRELGVFFWRGYTIQSAVDGWFCNKNDRHKGRQMPVHYGSAEHNIQSISSPLGTKIPQAAGIGYSLRIRKQPNICTVYFGDGAASEGDVSVGLNFAAVRKSQTLFICRNNQWAISTPIKDQYVSASALAERGAGFGIPSIRCDGNDLLAVYHATQASRNKIIKEQTPVFLETMSYRLGGHSTNDDPNRYIDPAEREFHQKHKPIDRTVKFMKKHDLLDFDIDEFASEIKNIVIETKEAAREVNMGQHDSFFEDVYDKIPANIAEQKDELNSHLTDYGNWYDNLEHWDVDIR